MGNQKVAPCFLFDLVSYYWPPNPQLQSHMSPRSFSNMVGFLPPQSFALAFFLLVSLFLQMSTPSVSSFPASLCSDVTFSRRPTLAILFSVAYLCPQPHSPAHSAPLISFTSPISLPSSIQLHSRGQRPWVYSLMLPEYHRHSLFIELLSG